jgi:alkylhydroperoxidase family enzyme
LEAPQRALLLFVLKVVRAPEAVQAADVEALREMGWTDPDIFDAAFHGTSMISASRLFKAFVK